MIQKGIVEQLINQYTVKVRVPKYDKLLSTPDGVKTEDLSNAIICNLPGTKIAYSVGDIVLVDYENGELGRPVVLGMLYCDRNIRSDSNIELIQSTSNASNVFKQAADQGLITHLRYSNDNGQTFTSLYDYTTVEEEVVESNAYIHAKDIVIDPTSSFVYWSIVDGNNIPITDSISIETVLYNNNESSLPYHESLIKVPTSLKGSSELFLSFNITRSVNLDDYHIVLTTDKNPIGTTYGDYAGIYVGNSSDAPDNTNAYSWVSFYNSFEFLTDKLEEALNKRLDKIEEDLYGVVYSSETPKETDTVGLLNGIDVSEDAIDVHGIDNKDIRFNTSGDIYIDNSEKFIGTPGVNFSNLNIKSEFVIVSGADGHLSLLNQQKIN